MRRDVTERLEQEPEIRALLSRGYLAIFEPGFGFGNNTRAMSRRGLLRWHSFYATEPNPTVCDYFRRRFAPSLGERFELHPGTIQDLVASAPPFDMLLVRGTLMYCSADLLRALFASLPQRGCRYVLILSEGHQGATFNVRSIRRHIRALPSTISNPASRPCIRRHALLPGWAPTDCTNISACWPKLPGCH